MAQDAINVWREMYNQGRTDNMPWLEGGQDSVRRLAMLLGLRGDSADPNFGALTRRFSMDDFQTDPGYGFRQSEGEKGVNRAAAARGRFLAPATVKELSSFNQDLASDEFGNAYARYDNDQNNLYNRLFGLSGQGQQAAGMNNQMGMNTASGISNIYMQQEALRQAKKASKGGFGGSLFGGLANLAGGYFGGGGSIARLLGGAGG